jgi:hypothetical protein
MLVGEVLQRGGDLGRIRLRFVLEGLGWIADGWHTDAHATLTDRGRNLAVTGRERTRREASSRYTPSIPGKEQTHAK